jgi:biopolymer transport protein ExbD
VDLGFLLLTFFMLTTTFSQPKVVELTPPVKTTEVTRVQDTLSLTLILGKSDTVWYYNGKLSPNADSANNMMFTDYSDNGLRKLVLNRNFYVRSLIKPYEEQLAAHKIADTTFARIKEKQEENKFATFVIIKTDTNTRYVNVVRALDEMNICDVGKYSLIDVTDDDMKMIADFKQKHTK